MSVKETTPITKEVATAEASLGAISIQPLIPEMEGDTDPTVLLRALVMRTNLMIIDAHRTLGEPVNPALVTPQAIGGEQAARIGRELRGRMQNGL